MNCKPGDLAVQVRCDFYERNIGAMYMVDSPCTCWHKAWECAPLQPVMEDIGLRGVVGRTCKPGHLCCVWDAELRPIRPGTHAPDQTTTTSKEKEHV